MWRPMRYGLKAKTESTISIRKRFTVETESIRTTFFADPQGGLVVRLRVHEEVQLSFAVQVLGRLALHPRPREARARHDGALDDVARAHVPQLHAHLRRAPAYLDVLHLQHLVQGAVHLQRYALPQVSGLYHLSPVTLAAWARGSSTAPSRSPSRPCPRSALRPSR